MKYACILVVVFLLLFHFAIAARNLDDFYPVGSDDVLIMSASYKLASQGVFGSDLMRTFGAERAFFFNLPVQNLLQAASFLLGGAGIGQARAPALVAALAIIGMTAWFGAMSRGWAVGALTAALLVFWRSGLVGPDPRPPLLVISQSARYDAAVVAFFWMGVLWLRATVLAPSRWRALAVGASAGVATLTQFYGVALPLLVAAVYFRQWGRSAVRQEVPQWTAIGFVLIVAPYLAYAALHVEAFKAQASLQGARVSFLDPGFWLRNLVQEPVRYAEAVRVSWASTEEGGNRIGLLALIFGVAPGAALLTRRCRWRGVAGELPWVSLAVLVLTLALTEHTKALIYSSILVPSLCLCLASAFDAAVRGGIADPRRPRRVALGAGAVVVLGLIIAEGVRGYRFAYRESGRVSSYLDVGARLAGAFDPDATILGSRRWWWALRAYDYRSIYALGRGAARLSQPTLPVSFREETRSTGASYLIVDKDLLGDISRATPDLRSEVERVLRTCSMTVASIDDRTYGLIEVRRILDCP